MTPKEALVWHLTNVFPILDGWDGGAFFTWKCIVFSLCFFLAWRNPMPYVWGGLVIFGLTPGFFFLGGDPISILTRGFLLWMCAEICFRSLAVIPESRIYGWWIFAVIFILVL